MILVSSARFIPQRLAAPIDPRRLLVIATERHKKEHYPLRIGMGWSPTHTMHILSSPALSPTCNMRGIKSASEWLP